MAFKALRGGTCFRTYFGERPATSHVRGPSHLYSLIAQRVNTPSPPKVPWKPRTMPRIDGPGPSGENHPQPDPALPSVTTSPVGKTHSTPSRFLPEKLVAAPETP